MLFRMAVGTSLYDVSIGSYGPTKLNRTPRWRCVHIAPLQTGCAHTKQLKFCTDARLVFLSEIRFIDLKRFAKNIQNRNR